MKTTNRYLLFLMASFCLLFGACSDNNYPLNQVRTESGTRDFRRDLLCQSFCL